MNEAPAETEIPEADPESLVPPEDDAGSQNTPVSTLPAASVTESQTARVSEDLSFTSTVSPVPSVCRSEAWNCTAFSTKYTRRVLKSGTLTDSQIQFGFLDCRRFIVIFAADLLTYLSSVSSKIVT